MISRDEFTAGLTQRLRLVLQKHAREIDERSRVEQDWQGEPLYVSAGLAEANTNLDAALLEVSDFVFDVLESKAPLEPSNAH